LLTEIKEDETLDNPLLLSHPHLRRALLKKGWPKIQGSCAATKPFGLEFFWIDNLCIEKRVEVRSSLSQSTSFSPGIKKLLYA
jgi:hypothetical protein